MNKIEIDLPMIGHEKTKELSFRFYKEENERGHSANVNVWVNEVDSVSAMQKEGIQKTKAFLSQMLEALDAEYPE